VNNEVFGVLLATLLGPASQGLRVPHVDASPPHLHHLERVRELGHQDERVVSALMYGSFALGEGRYLYL
jgi:hypothetical protein